MWPWSTVRGCKSGSGAGGHDKVLPHLREADAVPVRDSSLPGARRGEVRQGQALQAAAEEAMRALRRLLAPRLACGCRRWFGVRGWYERVCGPHQAARPVNPQVESAQFPLAGKRERLERGKR